MPRWAQFLHLSHMLSGCRILSRKLSIPPNFLPTQNWHSTAEMPHYCHFCPGLYAFQLQQALNPLSAGSSAELKRSQAPARAQPAPSHVSERRRTSYTSLRATVPASLWLTPRVVIYCKCRHLPVPKTHQTCAPFSYVSTYPAPAPPLSPGTLLPTQNLCQNTIWKAHAGNRRIYVHYFKVTLIFPVKTTPVSHHHDLDVLWFFVFRAIPYSNRLIWKCDKLGSLQKACDTALTTYLRVPLSCKSLQPVISYTSNNRNIKFCFCHNVLTRICLPDLLLAFRLPPFGRINQLYYQLTRYLDSHNMHWLAADLEGKINRRVKRMLEVP